MSNENSQTPPVPDLPQDSSQDDLDKAKSLQAFARMMRGITKGKNDTQIQNANHRVDLAQKAQNGDVIAATELEAIKAREKYETAYLNLIDNTSSWDLQSAIEIFQSEVGREISEQELEDIKRIIESRKDDPDNES